MLDLSNVWPEWQAVEKIGEGSFGKVYRCVRNEYGIESVCAIKVISIPQNDENVENMQFEGLSESASWAYLNDIVSDFSSEIKLMEMLKNAPNIVSVENFKIIKRTASIGWDIYIRMEYLTGFVEYASDNKLNEEDVFKLGKDICTALSVCAKKGIVHRDIKPDNIFVDEYGNYKLGDFGVARRLEKTSVSMSRKGTYSFMAPEVYREEHYDSRADIYSLGTVMYKLLNNNRDPFIDAHQPLITINERSTALARRRRGEPLPPPAFASPEAARIILKACAFNPDDRYNTVDEFKADIVKTMMLDTTYFSTDTEPKEKTTKPLRIKVFEIDHIGDNFLNAPVKEADKHVTNQDSGFSTEPRNFIFKSSNASPDAPYNAAHKPFRPMDKESGLPLEKQVTAERERGAEPNPFSDPSPQKSIQKNLIKAQGLPQKPTAQHQPVEPQYRAPVTPQFVPQISPQRSGVDDSAAKKIPVRNKISGGRIAAIIAVIVVIAGIISAAAYFLPGFIQEIKNAGNNVNKTVDHTSVVEKANGYNVEKYNSDDILFEIEEYNDENELKGYVEYVFGKDGKEIGYNKYNKSGKLVDEIRY